jgi:hypothetical protein
MEVGAMSAAGHGEKRSRKVEQAIAGLLTEATIGAAAQRAGVCEKTLRLWLDQPEFQRLYREARRSIVDRALGRIQALTDQAHLALERNLACGKPQVEVRAAEAVLTWAVQAVTVADLAGEVADLKRTLTEGDDGNANHIGDTPPRGGSAQAGGPEPGADADRDAGGPAG